MGHKEAAAVQPLIDQYNRRLKSANQANRKRFRQAMRLNRKVGKTGIRDVKRAGQEERGGIFQNLMQRGLGSTSLASSLAMRSKEGEQRNIADIREGVAQQRINLLGSRTDQAPDFGPYAALIGQATQAGANKAPSMWEQLLAGFGGSLAGGLGGGVGRGVGGLVGKLFS